MGFGATTSCKFFLILMIKKNTTPSDSTLNFNFLFLFLFFFYTLIQNQKSKLYPFFTANFDKQQPELNSDNNILLGAPFPPGLYPHMDKTTAMSSFGPIINHQLDRNKQISDMFLGGRDLFERSQLRSLSMPMLGMNQQFGSDTFQPPQFKPIKRHSVPNDMPQSKW
jgi:hypothetical protein